MKLACQDYTNEYGLYVHIPFCKSKCYYCSFYSEEYNENLADKFLDALKQEIVEFKSKYSISNPKIITVYIGGGTPSILKEQQIEKLLLIISTNFELYSVKEFNMEVNPESVTLSKIKLIKDFVKSTTNGCLRLSLGAQSFNDTILKLIGRIHTVSEIFTAIDTFNKLSIDNFNIDIIFGCPQQTVKEVKNDIQQAIILGTKHISCYALTIEESSKLYSYGYFPDDDLQADMYNTIVESLTKNGFVQYEISNFAYPGYECLHNLNYWLYNEYIGLGPSSVSFVNKTRIKNVSDLSSYINKNYKWEIETISEKNMIKEQIMLRLRTNKGIPFDSPLLNNYKDTLQKLINENKIIVENGIVRIAPRYLFLSNSILLEFI